MNREALIAKLPKDAPPIKTAKVLKDRILPVGGYRTSNLPEVYNLGEQGGVLAENPRMDGVAVVVSEDITDASGITRRRSIRVVEENKLRQGDEVVMAIKGDGSEGVLISPLEEDTNSGDVFRFMTAQVSSERRTPYSRLAEILLKAKQENRGKIIWVLGPAVDHAGGIEDMQWLVENGFVGALLAGNALAVHDMEDNILGTTLGTDRDAAGVPDGHRNHLEVITAVNNAGSIQAAVDQGIITNGIMYACVKNNVPFVLAGSIRDDGPLFDTIPDIMEAQDAMRAHTKKASAVVMVASLLHSIATGNMTPAYRVDGDEIVPIPLICVDVQPAAVTKLADRGTGQVYPVVTNAQDFLRGVRTELERLNPEPPEAKRKLKNQ